MCLECGIQIFFRGQARQRKAFEDEQRIFNFDLDRQKVIDALDNEIARVRQTLEEASGNAEEEK